MKSFNEYFTQERLEEKLNQIGWGSITIEIQKGRIVRLTEKKSVKSEDEMET